MQSKSRRSGTRLLSEVYRNVSASSAVLCAIYPLSSSDPEHQPAKLKEAGSNPAEDAIRPHIATVTYLVLSQAIPGANPGGAANLPDESAAAR